MRLILSSLLLLAFAGLARADIQDPPAKRFGSTRKLGRGIANIVYGSSEIGTTMIDVNEREGNAAAFTYGFTLGLQKTIERFGIGVFEVVTHPFPINKGNYRPYFPSPTRGVTNAFEEFPPEFGFDSKFDYVRPLN